MRWTLGKSAAAGVDNSNLSVASHPVMDGNEYGIKTEAGGIFSQEFARKTCWSVASCFPPGTTTAAKKTTGLYPGTAKKGKKKTAKTQHPLLREMLFQDAEFLPDFICVMLPPRSMSSSLKASSKNISMRSKRAKKIVDIMEYCKSVHPHLIFTVVEPNSSATTIALNRNDDKADDKVDDDASPLLIKGFDSPLSPLGSLYCSRINYCALVGGMFNSTKYRQLNKRQFVRVWTNDIGLSNRLNNFENSNLRRPMDNDVDMDNSDDNASVSFPSGIPDALTEEIAMYVDSKFYLDRIPYTKF